jgi:hypothetical protein
MARQRYVYILASYGRRLHVGAEAALLRDESRLSGP